MGDTAPGKRGIVSTGVPTGEQSQDGVQGLGDAPATDSGSRVPIDQESNEPEDGTRGQKPGGSNVETMGGEGEFPSQRSDTDGDAAGDRRKNEPVLTNYKIDSADSTFTSGGKKARFNANIKSLKTMMKVIQEGRNATSDEQRTIAQYSGWGP